MLKYFDISEHQGAIDWATLSKSAPDGVIIRAGYGQNNIDKQWLANIKACNALGIPAGAYWFSYAYTAAMAKREAEYFLTAVAPYKLELPLAFDWEYDSIKTCRKHGVEPTPALVQAMTKAFCEVIEGARYYCMVYTNDDLGGQYFGDLPGGRYDLWLAHWPKGNVDVNLPPRKCGIWQWGCTYPPGIKKTATYDGKVDTNEAYHDYKALISKLGLNQPPAPARPWYAEAQDWVKSTGISDGDKPDEPATRAQVWEMLYRYYRKNVGAGTGNKQFSGLIDD